MHNTLPLLRATAFPAVHRARLETLQVNLGYLCNQSCVHCHVNAGPRRTELMSRETVGRVLDFLRMNPGVQTLDITGGAPELNPLFRYLVQQARALQRRVIDRCNLTVLEQAGQHDLAAFLAAYQVEIIASLPCYLVENVDRQRGRGVFEASVRALQQLNALGYGKPESGLALNLVYNPQGAALPPPQAELEAAYRTHLGRYDIVFNRVLTIANMPIARFGSTLVSKGGFADYMQLLRNSHRDENLSGVMCRSLLSIDWQGYVYDCDFNQMLGLSLGAGIKPRTHIAELLEVDLEGAPIAVADHCYACTAGQGSSCGGALV